MSAKLVEFPATAITDIPGTLRKLADDIENGTDQVNNLVWVTDSEEYGIEVGMMGKCESPVSKTYYLLALAMRYRESVNNGTRTVK